MLLFLLAAAAAVSGSADPGSTSIRRSALARRLVHDEIRLQVNRYGFDTLGFTVVAEHVRDGVIGAVDLAPYPDGDLEWSCRRSLDDLRGKGFFITGVTVVTGAYLDLRYQGLGLGQAMLETAARHAALQNRAIAPHACVPFGSTSVAAARAWNAVQLRLACSGRVCFAGAFPSTQLPG